MFESLNTPELCRLSLVVGAFTAIKYKDKHGIIPGGIIVPGFIIILFLVSPIWCVTVLVLSFVIYWLYKRFLDRTGYKRRTPMYLLATLSLAIAHCVAFVYVQLGWLVPSLDNLSGALLPAVIAFTFTKQKMPEVVKGIVFTTLITVVIVTIVYAVGSRLFHLDFDTIRPAYAGKDKLELKYPIIQFYVALTVGYLIYRSRDIRSGGYTVAPVAAALFVYPLSAIVFLIGTTIVYFLTQLICELTLIIGLKRYTLALFLSTIVVWSSEILFLHINSTILPFQGSNIFVIITMMSYVNDGLLFKDKSILSVMGTHIVLAIVFLVIINIVSIIFV